MNSAFNAPLTVEALPYTLPRRATNEHAAALTAQRGVEVLHRPDGTPLALFTDTWRLNAVQRDHPQVVLEPLTADRVP